jgi:hypothetical protein
MNPNPSDPCAPIWLTAKYAIDALTGLGALLTALFGLLAYRYEKSVAGSSADKPKSLLPFGKVSIAVLGLIAVFNFAAIFAGQRIQGKIGACGRKQLEAQNELLTGKLAEMEAKLGGQVGEKVASLNGPLYEIRQNQGRQSVEGPLNALAITSYTVSLRIPQHDKESGNAGPLLKTLLQNEKKFCGPERTLNELRCRRARKDLLRMSVNGGWLGLVDPEGEKSIALDVTLQGDAVGLAKDASCKDHFDCIGYGRPPKSMTSPGYQSMDDDLWGPMLTDESYWKSKEGDLTAFVSHWTDLKIKVRSSGMHGMDTNLSDVKLKLCSSSERALAQGTDLSHLELLVSVDPVGTISGTYSPLPKVYPIEAEKTCPKEGKRCPSDDAKTTCASYSYHTNFQ